MNMNIYDEFSLNPPSSECTSAKLIPCDQITSKKYNQYIEATDQSIKSLDEFSYSVLSKANAHFDALWDSDETCVQRKDSDIKENCFNCNVGEHISSKKLDDTDDSMCLTASGNLILMTDNGNLIEDSICSSYKCDEFNRIFKESTLDGMRIDSFENIRFTSNSINCSSMENQLSQISLCVEVSN